MISRNGNQNQTLGIKPAMMNNKASAMVMTCINLAGANRVIRPGAKGAIASIAAACTMVLSPISDLLTPWESSTSAKRGKEIP